MVGRQTLPLIVKIVWLLYLLHARLKQIIFLDCFISIVCSSKINWQKCSNLLFTCTMPCHLQIPIWTNGAFTFFFNEMLKKNITCIHSDWPEMGWRKCLHRMITTFCHKNCCNSEDVFLFHLTFRWGFSPQN